MDWSRWPNFCPEEFRCSHTGRDGMDSAFMDRLQALRTEYGRPLLITSGYRDPSHPIEAPKTLPGSHAVGRAADIAVHGGDALQVIDLALALGFTGFGVSQNGGSRFIHLDDLLNEAGRPRPWLWSY